MNDTMHRSVKSSSSQPVHTDNNPDSTPYSNSPNWPQEDAGILRNVSKLLQNGENEAAFDAVQRSKSRSPWLTNAAGVCLLRMGKYQLAVDTFRRLLMSGGVVLKQDSPDIFKLNFATALLLNKNYSGFSTVTCEIRDQSLPELMKLRESLAAWKSTLPRWQRFLWSLGIEPKQTYVPDFLPGSLG